VEGADPDYMIQRSFHQFQKDRAALEVQEQKRDLEAELGRIEDLKAVVEDDTKYSFNVDEAIADYFYITKELEKKKEEIRQVMIKPDNIAPFLNPGRILYLKSEEADWSWGILISAGIKKSTNSTADTEQEENEPQWVLEVFLRCEPGSVANQQPAPPTGTKAEGHILPMSLNLVQDQQDPGQHAKR